MDPSNNQNALFSPIKVGQNLLNHRVVLAPLSRMRAGPGFVPTDLQVEYYKQRSSQGGLLISEATGISRLSGGVPHAPGIYTQDQIGGWKKVTDAIHAKDAHMYLQLWHMGRCGSRFLNPNGEPPVSASAIPMSGKNLASQDFEVPHPLEIDKIKTLFQDYRQAALNAIEAGFDGVEIHASSGFLIERFLQEASNHRTDMYGGSMENRVRFALEVLDAVVDAVGADHAAIRFSPNSEYHEDTTNVNEPNVWAYMTTEIQKKHPNLSYLHFIEGRAQHDNDGVINVVDTLATYRQLWKGPFISAGGYSNANEHAMDLAEKTGNLISFGRMFIANPDLPKRLRNGWELNKYDRSTFYTTDAVGYTDYPFYDSSKN